MNNIAWDQVFVVYAMVMGVSFIFGNAIFFIMFAIELIRR